MHSKCGNSKQNKINLLKILNKLQLQNFSKTQIVSAVKYLEIEHLSTQN